MPTIGRGGPMLLRGLVALVVLGTGLTLIPQPVGAAEPVGDFVLQSADDRVTLKDENGTLTGELTITNLGATSLDVAIEPDDGAIEGCVFSLAPSTVPARRTVTLTISSKDCQLPDNGVAAQLIIDGDAGPGLTLAADEPGDLDEGMIVVWFVVALVAAALTSLAAYRRRPSASPDAEKYIKAQNKRHQEILERLATPKTESDRELKAFVDNLEALPTGSATPGASDPESRWAEDADAQFLLGLIELLEPPTDGRSRSEHRAELAQLAASAERRPQPPFHVPVPGLKSDWSLSDSWASNLSLLGTAFAALFGATDVLTAVLGAKPEVAVGRVLIASAIAALLLAAAPMALKALGKTPAPCVGGLCVAAGFTMTGVITQVLTTGWAVACTDVEGFLEGVVIGAAVVVAVGLLAYGYQTVKLLLREAFAPPKAPEVTDETLIAASVLAIHGDPTGDVFEVASLLRKVKKSLEAPSDDEMDVWWPPSPWGRRQTSIGARSAVL